MRPPFAASGATVAIPATIQNKLRSGDMSPDGSAGRARLSDGSLTRQTKASTDRQPRERGSSSGDGGGQPGL